MAKRRGKRGHKALTIGGAHLGAKAIGRKGRGKRGRKRAEKRY
jgi:hypothetical protein